MKLTGFAFVAALAALGTVPALAAPITIGVNNAGNCYPGLCNDSGANVGPSIEYQQVYTSTAFSGVTPINSITFYFDQAFGGNSDILAGHYNISLGYTSKLVNGLSTNLGSNILSGLTLFSSTNQGGGTDANPFVTINGNSPFSYDPSLGNLLLEIDVFNQALVPNGSGNGYFQDDESGQSMSRAYCFHGASCTTSSDGLVTTFNQVIPEPVTVSLFGVGLAGIAGLRRKRAGKKA
jgi:hypothetical protein